MRLVVQRVTRASVRAGDELLGEIGLGAVVLVGIGTDDDAGHRRPHGRQAHRPALLRATPRGGRTWRSPTSAGALLVVSQFTLLRRRQPRPSPGLHRRGAARAGRSAGRSVRRAAAGEPASTVETGRFGAEMEVELVNDGPFTLVLDSDAIWRSRIARRPRRDAGVSVQAERARPSGRSGGSGCRPSPS